MNETHWKILDMQENSRIVEFSGDKTNTVLEGADDQEEHKDNATQSFQLELDLE